MHEFVCEVAEIQCRASNIEHRRGRPPKGEEAPPSVSSKNKNLHLPTDDIRFDGIDHLPTTEKDTGVRCRCQQTGCKSRSQIYCIKCRVHLYCNSDRDCFLKCHTQSLKF